MSVLERLRAKKLADKAGGAGETATPVEEKKVTAETVVSTKKEAPAKDAPKKEAVDAGDDISFKKDAGKSEPAEKAKKLAELEKSEKTEGTGKTEKTEKKGSSDDDISFVSDKGTPAPEKKATLAEGEEGNAPEKPSPTEPEDAPEAPESAIIAQAIEEKRLEMAKAVEDTEFEMASTLKKEIAELTEEHEKAVIAEELVAKAEEEASAGDAPVIDPNQCDYKDRAGRQCTKPKGHEGRHWYKVSPTASVGSSTKDAGCCLKNGKIHVSKQFSKSGEILDTETEEESIDVKAFETDTASVSVMLGMTVNMGNYESCKVDVHCTVPCYVEEMPEAFQFAKTFITERLNKEVEDIRSVKE